MSNSQFLLKTCPSCFCVLETVMQCAACPLEYCSLKCRADDWVTHKYKCGPTTSNFDASPGSMSQMVTTPINVDQFQSPSSLNEFMDVSVEGEVAIATLVVDSDNGPQTQFESNESTEVQLKSEISDNLAASSTDDNYNSQDNDNPLNLCGQQNDLYFFEYEDDPLQCGLAEETVYANESSFEATNNEDIDIDAQLNAIAIKLQEEPQVPQFVVPSVDDLRFGIRKFIRELGFVSLRENIKIRLLCTSLDSICRSVVYFTDPSHSYYDVIRQHLHAMSKYYDDENMNYQTYEPMIDEVCIGRFMGCWVRVVCVNQMSGDEYVMRLIDSGKISIFRDHLLYPISSKWMFPFQTHPCFIQDLPPEPRAEDLIRLTNLIERGISGVLTKGVSEGSYNCRIVLPRSPW